MKTTGANALVRGGVTAADLVSLTKPRLSTLVLCTTAGGMWLAPGRLPLSRALIALVATAGTVGAANALNCWLERDVNRAMARTRSRPLPAGRMEPAVALAFGLSLAAFSLPALTLAANALTGLLGLTALVLYVTVYTPMKARSEHAMLVGAIPGALPPMMGWTAVTGVIDAPAVALFGILFFWQLPHFLAIALFRKEEYARAGLTSVPLARGDDVARHQILTYLVLLVPVTSLPYAFHVAGPLYVALAAALDAVFLGVGAWGYFRRGGRPWARRLFVVSIFYLAALFGALGLDGGPRA